MSWLAEGPGLHGNAHLNSLVYSLAKNWREKKKSIYNIILTELIDSKYFISKSLHAVIQFWDYLLSSWTK